MKIVPAMNCEAVPAPEFDQIRVTKTQQIPENDMDLAITKVLRQETPGISSGGPKDLPIGSSISMVSARRPASLSLVQLNFIDDGLILVWNVHHYFGYSTTWYSWAQIWAEKCRKASGFEIVHPFPTPSRRVTPGSMPPALLLETHRAQFFYFYPVALAVVDEEASPKNVVQKPIDSLFDKDPNSHFGSAVDGRSRMNPPTHPEPQGCWPTYAHADIRIPKLLSGSLADIAIELRRSIAKIHDDWTGEMGTLVDGLVDANRMIAKGFVDMPGKNFTQASAKKSVLLGGHCILQHRVLAPLDGSTQSLAPGCQNQKRLRGLYSNQQQSVRDI
ncbi:hypothetical protein BJ878DRAFT_477574 [Calycina marina]|uniref:Uncharacterized protein n=1 Tax=Calycina marina TaxID=1763456 RepID=A0A9P7Z8B7_9HELO|nr:hypothetical protein BJ878DRAFT_477574 [Calycina marina]